MQESIPRITGTLRAHTIEMPEVIREASGIIVLGRKIRSLIFSTDIAIIRNCDADAVLAVYPFTPQQVISEAIINASSPVAARFTSYWFARRTVVMKLAMLLSSSTSKIKYLFAIFIPPPAEAEM